MFIADYISYRCFVKFFEHYISMKSTPRLSQIDVLGLVEKRFTFPRVSECSKVKCILLSLF